MLTLAIEASNPSIAVRLPRSAPAVAIGEVAPDGGVRVLGVEAIQPASRHDDDLTAAIARLHERLGLTAHAVGRIAVSVGPGGYTSLRMACATAQMIALATGARCVAVPTAAVALRTLRKELPPGPVAIALSGKADAAFVTVYAGAGARPDQPVEPGRLVTAADLAVLARPACTLVADEHLPAPMREAAARLGLVVVPTALDVSALLWASVHFPDVDAAACVPLYGREPEAVTKWRVLHGGGAAPRV